MVGGNNAYKYYNNAELSPVANVTNKFGRSKEHPYTTHETEINNNQELNYTNTAQSSQTGGFPYRYYDGAFPPGEGM